MNNARLLIATAILGLSANFAFADAPVDPAHPREAQVNERLNNQDARIDNKEADGAITPKQAAKLHKKDRKIAKKEMKDEAKHDGHITPEEQAKLNTKEDKVSGKIGPQ